MRKALLFISLLFAGTLLAQRDTSKVLDLSTRFQFAGLQGTFSTGVFHNFKKDHFMLGLMYGFSPSGEFSRAYHGITLRSTYAWRALEKGTFKFEPYVQISANLEVGKTAFFSLPDNFPDDYYGPQSLHAIGGVGVKTKTRLGLGELALTLETVTLDTYLWYLIIQKQIDFEEVWSMSLGLEYRFNK